MTAGPEVGRDLKHCATSCARLVISRSPILPSIFLLTLVHLVLQTCLKGVLSTMSHVDLIDFFPWQAIRGLASRSSSNSSSSDDSPSPDQNSTSSSSVQWMSPAAGDTFGPGELIAIKWKATDRATSPSFRVCEGDEDHCGAMVWPQIEQSGDSYATKLYVFNTVHRILPKKSGLSTDCDCSTVLHPLLSPSPHITFK